MCTIFFIADGVQFLGNVHHVEEHILLLTPAMYVVSSFGRFLLGICDIFSCLFGLLHEEFGSWWMSEVHPN